MNTMKLREMIAQVLLVFLAMMLITCGDKYESGSNATSKLYMLLKARS